ncbi:MAG: type I DNA topoisomerase [Candidatus Ratteibacteria bacterium]|nr:type I DNA topoisomerase [Candidatus Ratteibacteria bacterium]
MAEKSSLVIVESPAKARTIQSFLGRGYKVSASMGHIKNLPERKLGIDIEHGFEPTYNIIKGKKKILKELKSEAKKSSQVLLAADADREGETICAHLAEEIEPVNKNISRILFHEITSSAIKDSLKHVTSIDINKVDSGKARRVLDRLVGYKISPLLWKKVRKGLSAGRVQTVALKIVVDREKEIKAFVPEEYYLIFGKFANQNKEEFSAQLKEFKGEKITKFSKDEAPNIKMDAEKQSFIVKSIISKDEKRKAPAPLITSSMQQQAHRVFHFSAQRTMRVAQQLYEGVNIGNEITGLITYMRTDSFNLSKSAQEKAREFILKNFGKEYLPATAPKFKAKKGAQEAHEAIRPTNVEFSPDKIKEYLDPYQLRLYTLIYNRFLASQMSPKITEVTTIKLEGGDYVFVTENRKTKFDGYTILVKKDEEENGSEETNILPVLKEQEKVKLLEVALEQKFTQPPPRYTEGTLIKKLEEEGIGRPSTYAPIMNTIKDRDYIRSVKGELYPSELGTVVVELLIENFPTIFYEKFTSEMEQNLDEVEEGKRKWSDMVKDFYTSFEPVLNKASVDMKDIKKEREVITDEKCPECGGNLIVKDGRFGQFLACSNFPRCRYTKRMLKKVGMKCPNQDCGGEIVEMKNKRGRVFYGCSNYPNCRWIASYLPSEKLEDRKQRTEDSQQNVKDSK